MTFKKTARNERMSLKDKRYAESTVGGYLDLSSKINEEKTKKQHSHRETQKEYFIKKIQHRVLISQNDSHL